ncbi:MAG: YitT family protein [Microbacter sp.]
MFRLRQIKGIRIPSQWNLRPTRESVRDHLLIVIGLMIYAFAWKGILIPHQITGGGVTGISALLFYAFGTPISITYFIINAALLIISIRSIGIVFSLRTIFGVGVLTLLFALIPIMPKGVFIDANETFMACVVGGILSGVGIGMVFMANGSSGGTDIIVKMLHKYRNVTLGRAMVYCDVLIISSSYLIFGSIEKVVYGLVTMAIYSITVDTMINGVRQSVQFFIISKEYEAIADRINTEIHRGVTILNGEGWYTHEQVKVLMVIARKNQSLNIFRLIKAIDPDAFVSQGSVIGVYGQGFDAFKLK